MHSVLASKRKDFEMKSLKKKVIRKMGRSIVCGKPIVSCVGCQDARNQSFKKVGVFFF